MDPKRDAINAILDLLKQPSRVRAQEAVEAIIIAASPRWVMREISDAKAEAVDYQQVFDEIYMVLNPSIKNSSGVCPSTVLLQVEQLKRNHEEAVKTIEEINLRLDEELQKRGL